MHARFDRSIEFVHTSEFEFGQRNDSLLMKAKEKAKNILSYALQFAGMLEIANYKKIIAIDKVLLNNFRVNVSHFYGLSDNPYSVNYNRIEFLKAIRRDYHSLKPYFLVSQQGLSRMGEETSPYTTALTKLRGLLNLDEPTCACIWSLSLLEIAVNKKLTELGQQTMGDFEERHKRLVATLRQKENKKLQAVLPPAMYKVRSLLLHGGHEFLPTSSESAQIIEWIEYYFAELFEKPKK